MFYPSHNFFHWKRSEVNYFFLCEKVSLGWFINCAVLLPVFFDGSKWHYRSFVKVTITRKEGRKKHEKFCDDNFYSSELWFLTRRMINKSLEELSDKIVGDLEIISRDKE